MQLALDESQKELALSRGERDKAIRNSAQVQSRFDDMEVSISNAYLTSKTRHLCLESTIIMANTTNQSSM